MRMLRRLAGLVVVSLVLGAGSLLGQAKADGPEFDVKEHYTKYEYRIAMRDGVRLFTSVYVPKDDSKTYPFLINRTPYSVAPYGVDQYRTQLGPSPDFDKAGYIFVNQDVRGRFMSEGTFVEMRPHIDNKKSKSDVDDSSDLYDTIEWLLKNVPNNNGKAGIWRISYPGFFTSASMIDTHPALKAASPQGPMTDLFKGDDAYHGGGLVMAAQFRVFSFFPPAWYFEPPTNVLVPFCEAYLREDGKAKLPKAYMFETGTNVWRQYASWPPKNVQAKTLYFHANGVLSFEPPKQEATAYDEYVSDPTKPVPFVNYVAQTVPQEYMLSDQRFAASRTDVLTYQTEVLQEDVTIAGPVSPKLFVSTTGTDSDWDVKLIDVYPPDYPASKLDEPRPEEKGKPRTDVGAPEFTMCGYEQLVRGEPFRGKFRHSFEKPEAFTPGKVEEVTFAMQDGNHTFQRGHRIMVQIQSSWFPLTDRNPQTFMNIPDAKISDFVKATERVYHGVEQASGIEANVIVLGEKK